MKPTWSPLGAHLEITCGPLGVHLDSKGVPKAPRRSKSSQNVRESTVLQASLSLLEAHVEALEATWKPLAGYLGSREAPKAPRRAKSSQTVRVSMVLQVLQATQRALGAAWRPFGSTWRSLGAHLASTWTLGCTWSSAEEFQERAQGQNRARTRE